jgi:hypothetical protein
MTNANPRYQGKPLLRLLECYVLWAIDGLPEDNQSALEKMTPKLQDAYGVKGTWQAILEAVLKLPSNMADLIRDVWSKNCEIARKNNATLEPQQFAEMFVDQNLVG